MPAHHFHLLVSILCASAAGYEVVNAKTSLLTHEADFPGHLTMHVYAPKSEETFPVIWFATGFGCAVPVSLYSKLINGIVSEGYIVAGLYHEVPHVPTYIADGQHFHDIMEWGKEKLSVWMAGKKLAAVPDVLGRSAVMAQSAGNHIVGQALTDGCSVAKAFIMIDPVDGFDPYRMIKSEDLIKPGEKVKFNIPALLLDNGLDPRTVNRFYPPCAPPNVSNDHFYNAWRGPIWNINATAYGHTDCTDYPNGAVCPVDPNVDKDMYRAMLSDAIISFLGALFGNRPEQLSVLEDDSHWKVNVVLKHDLKGKNYTEIKAGCANVAPLPTVVV